MKIKKADNLTCPLDGAHLEQQEKQLVCENGHTFDIARQGYVNLLPVQHKRTKQPGDSKAMVSARAGFLNSGIYKPIADYLAGFVCAQIADENAGAVCLMDAGCGEGYYLDYVFNALKKKKGSNELSFIGVDISKEAIGEAAKRNKLITWIVGTNRQPPVEPESVDIVLCVFGFQSFEGFHKILATGGRVILVEPGPDHLQELREIIYREVRRTDLPDLAHADDIGFSLIDRQHLQFKTRVTSNEQIRQLLVMTPHFYRATRQGREAAENLQELDLSIDIVFRLLEKT